jgi:hypothetical protein
MNPGQTFSSSVKDSADQEYSHRPSVLPFSGGGYGVRVRHGERIFLAKIPRDGTVSMREPVGRIHAGERVALTAVC